MIKSSMQIANSLIKLPESLEFVTQQFGDVLQELICGLKYGRCREVILLCPLLSGSTLVTVVSLYQVSLWKESREGEWVCVSEVDKGQQQQQQQQQQQTT